MVLPAEGLIAVRWPLLRTIRRGSHTDLLGGFGSTPGTWLLASAPLETSRDARRSPRALIAAVETRLPWPHRMAHLVDSGQLCRAISPWPPQSRHVPARSRIAAIQARRNKRVSSGCHALRRAVEASNGAPGHLHIDATTHLV